MVSLILPAKFRPPLSQTLINLNPHINSSSKPKKPTLSFTSAHHTEGEGWFRLFESGRTQEAISALDAIAHKALKVSSKTYTKLLDCCVESNSIDLGRELHARVDDLDLFVGTKLVGMYAKCGSLADARKACPREMCGWLSLAWEIFTRMMVRDVVSWNSIVYAYCRAGMNDEARRFFGMMCDEDIEPGWKTWNILIDGYCDTALNLKKEMEGVELTPDAFTWTSLISGFAKSIREVRALELFIEMLSLGSNRLESPFLL
ncbi:Pentatricopeptide repeat-containing protein [Drosera capensis]